MASSTRSGGTRSVPSSFGSAAKNLCSAVCATDPRSFGVDLGVDRLRVEQTIDEPRRRAVGHALELGDGEGRPGAERFEHDRVTKARRSVLGSSCAVEPALPAVRARDPVGLGRLVAGDGRERAQPLAVGRRVLEAPRQLREPPPRGRPLDLVAREEGADLLPEGARLLGAALVGRGLAHEVQAPRRPRAGRVEEVAVAAHLVGALQPAAESLASLVVEERRSPAAPRQASFFEPEHEDDLEPSRARALEVEHRDLARLRALTAQPRALERGDHVVRADRLLDPKLPRAELVEQAQARGEGPQVVRGRLSYRRVLETVRRAEHRLRERAHGVDRRRPRTQRLELTERRAAKLLHDGLDPLGLHDRTAAQAPLHEVDVRTRQPRVR